MQLVGLCAGGVEETISGWNQYSRVLPPGGQTTLDKLADLIVSSFAQRTCPPFRQVRIVGHADKDWHGSAFEGRVSFERAMTVQSALTATVTKLWTSRGMGAPPPGGVEWAARGEGSKQMVKGAYHSANRRVVVTLSRTGAPLPPPPVSQLVSPRGTPLNPKKTGSMINIFGEKETEPGFVNYTSDPKFAVGGDGVRRPWTKDPARPPGLEDHSASDICLRSSPLSPITLNEMERIAAPGARITIALNSGPDDDKPGSTNEQLQRVRDKFPGRTTLFDGVHRGASDNGNPTDWKVLVIELP